MDKFFDEENLYHDIETYANQHQMSQTIIALPYAKEMHKGQFRKGKEKVPYIYHPLCVARHALALGLDDDTLLSAALLHDVCEDCGVAVQDLPVNEEAKQIVALLTKEKTPFAKSEAGKQAYYFAISQNAFATMIKLLDRCNNVSSMAAGFSREKIVNYIEETQKYFYPLMEYGKKTYPMYHNQIFIMEYQILSVVESLKVLL